MRITLFALLLTLAGCARTEDNPASDMLFRSPLVRSLHTWTEQGGNLGDVLGSSSEQSVETKAEAEAVCAALDALRDHPERNTDQSFSSPLHTLTAFFQQVKGRAAFAVLQTEGLPRLRPWARDFIAGRYADKNTAMFVLKVLAMYHQREDVDLIVETARRPVDSDGFMWSVILRQFDETHPHTAVMVDALRDPLPTGFILVSYLDTVNALALKGALSEHPFDSASGRAELERWLRDTNDENFSYAHSATAALPFIAPPARGTLLAIAGAHPDPSVRMEAAWAQAKSGDDAGLDQLAALCLDPMQSHTAQHYLEELGHLERIPSTATKPDFRAVTEMANWLAHPQEYGRPPSHIELFDSRELYWPPTRDRRRVWLVKYTYPDGEDGAPDIGVGMVGSVTFALFGEATADLKPEDIYALHCCWELEMNDDSRAPEKRSVEAGRKLLRARNHGF